MRINVYAEELTERVEIIGKEIDGHTFTGLRIYLELPATVDGKQYQGPFMHRPGDDDSSAVTFWGKRDLRVVLKKALAMLDEHYEKRDARLPSAEAVTSARREIEEEDARYEQAYEQARKTPEYEHAIAENGRRSKLPSEHPDHIHGMMCDGQDGPRTSYCGRLRAKLFGDKA